jgi:ACS family glucarate transporter-like MFS transporter
MKVSSPTIPGTRLSIRYLLVLWLMVVSAVAYLDRTNVSIAGLEICNEFSISQVRLGWIFSAFLIGYASFQIPAGLFARRMGPRRALGLLGAWWGFFIALTALIPPHVGNALLILLLVRFALGAGEATMYPATSQFVERWFPVKERGRANGIIFAGVGLGAGLTPLFVTAIILHHGWRTSFGISAGLGAATGLVWWLVSRDVPQEHPAAGNTELTLIVAGRRAPQIHEAAPGVRRDVPWSRIFRCRAILAMTFSYFTYGYVAWIFFAWMYIYMATARGVNLKSSAIDAMLPPLAMTIGCLCGGVLCDRIATRYGLRMGRCLVPCVAFALTAALLVAGSRVHGERAAVLLLASGAGSLYLAQSSYWAVSADVAGEFTSIVAGMVNMGGQIGGAVTASLTRLIAARFGWETSFVVAAVLAVLGGLAWLAVDPNRQLTPVLSTPKGED